MLQKRALLHFKYETQLESSLFAPASFRFKARTAQNTMLKKNTFLCSSLLLLAVSCGGGSDFGGVFDGDSTDGWSATEAGATVKISADEGGNDALSVKGENADGASFSLAVAAGEAAGSIGVTFKIRGSDSVRFSATANGAEWNAYGAQLPDLSESWSTVTLTWDQLGTTGTTFDPATITHLNWEIIGEGSYNIWIDDVDFIASADSTTTLGDTTATGGADGLGMGTGGTDSMMGTGGADIGSGGTTTVPSTNALGKYVTKELFEGVFRDRAPIYTYEALLTAVDQFSGFASCCSDVDKKLEIAAFLAHVQHEADFLKAADEYTPPSTYCRAGDSWPCAGAKSYHGRGALQLTWNYNYGMAQDYFASQGQNYDLLARPEQVSTDPTLVWSTALWFWMVGEPMTISMSEYVRNQGFGASIRKINGALECDGANAQQVNQRISYFESWCTRLGIDSSLAAPLGC